MSVFFRPSLLLTTINLVTLVWMVDYWIRPKPCWGPDHRADLLWEGKALGRCGFDCLWAKPVPLSPEEITRFAQRIDSTFSWLNQVTAARTRPGKGFVSISGARPLDRRLKVGGVDLGLQVARSVGGIELALIEWWLHRVTRLDPTYGDDPIRRSAEILLHGYGISRWQDPVTGLWVVPQETPSGVLRQVACLGCETPQTHRLVADHEIAAQFAGLGPAGKLRSLMALIQQLTDPHREQSRE